ncbi:MAG TPA: hypothetical protein DDZ40_07765 [Deltaproteobacteria bacterium]|nr:hypothetical protein [Deltaproteobacteria bacterium]
MIESIAQGYAAKFISSVAGRILTSDKTGDDAAGCSVASSDNAGPDNISISAKSRLLSMNDLLLPTAATVQALSATLSQDLQALLAGAGIATEPPVEIDVDDRTMEIALKGNRPDKKKIEALIDGDEKVKNEIRTVAAISSHAVAMTRSMKFQKEYLARTNAESTVAKYADLFQQQKPCDISLSLDNAGIHVLANGKEWG